VNEKKKPCSCANCDFRDVVFSYLDDTSVEDYAITRRNSFFRKGKYINHEGEKSATLNTLKATCLNFTGELLPVMSR